MDPPRPPSYGSPMSDPRASSNVHAGEESMSGTGSVPHPLIGDSSSRSFQRSPPSTTAPVPGRSLMPTPSPSDKDRDWPASSHHPSNGELQGSSGMGSMFRRLSGQDVASSLDSLRKVFSAPASPEEKIQFWKDPERAGWLMKQGEYIKTWRRRWFVLKQGKIFWFKEGTVTQQSKPRGVICVNQCLTIKGAEDILNKPFAFELSTSSDTMFFIADSDKEKEDWINSVGRSIVKHSKSVTEDEVLDYCDSYG